MADHALRAWALSQLGAGPASVAAAAAAMQVNTGVDLLLTAAATNQVDLLTYAVELQSLPVDVLLQWAPPTALGAAAFPRRRTLCMVAAATGSFDAVHYLLTKGSDPNFKSPDDGATALHCAAESGHPRTAEVIALLLSFGGQRDLMDGAGRRPVDLLAELIETQKGVLLSGNGEVGADVPGLCTGPSELDKDEYRTDEFRMYGFKVTKCCKSRAHDWTECPFAHPGEKARRRDPTHYSYSGSACPDFRKGTCKRGDSCQFAHGVFECWLHPLRYRTQLCKDAPMCNRRVCFFAHSLEELRQPPEQQGSADSTTTTSSTASSTPSSRAASPDATPTTAATTPDSASLWDPLTSASSLTSTTTSTTPSPLPPVARTPTPDPKRATHPLTSTPSKMPPSSPLPGSSPPARSPLQAPPQPQQAPLLSPLALATALQHMGGLSLQPPPHHPHAAPPLDPQLLSHFATAAAYPTLLPPASAPLPLHHPAPLPHTPHPDASNAAVLMQHLQLLAGQGNLAATGNMTTGSGIANGLGAPQGSFGALRTASYEALDRWITMLTGDGSGSDMGMGMGAPAAAMGAVSGGLDGSWQGAGNNSTDYQMLLLQQQQQQQGCMSVAAR